MPNTETPGKSGTDAVSEELAEGQDGPIAVPPVKNAAAQALGQLGGKKRASMMSPERRSEIARLAARRRWDTA